MDKKRLFALFLSLSFLPTFICVLFLYFYTDSIFNNRNNKSNKSKDLKIATTTTIKINNDTDKKDSGKNINNINNKGNISTNIRSKVAIVIDDLGIEYPKTKDFLESNIKLTFAIIPDTPIADKIYEYCINKGLTIILHLPMEANFKKVEDNAIFIRMGDEEIINRLNYFFEKYNSIIGANNHMGSRATQDKRVMNLILTNIKNRDLIWLDSVTSSNKTTKGIAKDLQIKYLERDVFLDNEKDFKYIKKQMEYLISIAKKKGSAIGIGHVSSGNLLSVLREYYKKESELGIEFVYLNEL